MSLLLTPHVLFVTNRGVVGVFLLTSEQLVVHVVSIRSVMFSSTSEHLIVSECLVTAGVVMSV